MLRIFGTAKPEKNQNLRFCSVFVAHVVIKPDGSNEMPAFRLDFHLFPKTLRVSGREKVQGTKTFGFVPFSPRMSPKTD